MTFSVYPMVTTPTNITTNSKYIPALDGVRGMAILMVVGFHYFDAGSFFSIGWAGVDLFFVLSGYLITKRLMENKDKSDRYARFYKNRALRIFPLYYLTLILFYCCIFFLVRKENFERFHFYFENAPAYFLFFENWVTIIKGFPLENYLGHFWSLAIEEQFYLVWPLVLYSFYSHKYFKRNLWIIIAVIPVIRLIFYFINPSFEQRYPFYYNTFCRIDTIIWGALVYYVVPKERNSLLFKKAGLISLAILIAGLFLFKDPTYTGPFFVTIGYTLLACIFASIIYRIASLPQSSVGVFFNNVLLRKIGKISYGIYIMHWPVFLIVNSQSKILSQRYFTVPPDYIKAFSIIAGALLTYLISYISFYYFEVYFLKQKNKHLMPVKPK